MDTVKSDWAQCLARLPAVPADKLALLTDSLRHIKANERTTVGARAPDIPCAHDAPPAARS